MITYSLRSLPLDSIFTHISNNSSQLSIQFQYDDIILPFTLHTIYESIYSSQGILKEYDSIVEQVYGTISNYTFSLEKRFEKIYLVITCPYPFILSAEQTTTSITNFIPFLVYEEVLPSNIIFKSKRYSIDIHTDNMGEIASLINEDKKVDTLGTDLVLLQNKYNEDSIGLNTNQNSKYITRASNGDLIFTDTSPVSYKFLNDYQISSGTSIDLVPQAVLSEMVGAKIHRHVSQSEEHITAVFPHLGHTTDSLYYVLTTTGTFIPLLYAIKDSDAGILKYIAKDENIYKIYGIYNIKKITYMEKGLVPELQTAYGFIKNTLSSSKHKIDIVELTYSSYLVTLSYPTILVLKGNISIDGIPYKDLDCIALDPGKYVVTLSNNSLSDLRTSDTNYINYSIYKDLISAYTEESYTYKYVSNDTIINTMYGTYGIDLYYIHNNTIFSKETIYFNPQEAT